MIFKDYVVLNLLGTILLDFLLKLSVFGTVLNSLRNISVSFSPEK
jgi:hypothetical protein